MKCPADCLLAPPAELAPIVAEIMGWSDVGLQPPDGSFLWGRGGKGFHMFTEIADAFRLQDRIAELGPLAIENYTLWLLHALDFEEVGITTGPTLAYGNVVLRKFRTGDLFRIATATPLQRTRAACAAWLESKENK